jgi:hypothetical protein
MHCLYCELFLIERRYISTTGICVKNIISKQSFETTHLIFTGEETIRKLDEQPFKFPTKLNENDCSVSLCLGALLQKYQELFSVITNNCTTNKPRLLCR